MGEIDPAIAVVLCDAIQASLSSELGDPVEIIDVSAQGYRWDFEAKGSDGCILRRISHTTTESDHRRRAMAEVFGDVGLAVEERLEQLGVRDRGLSIHGQDLPKRRAERRALGRIIADRVASMAPSFEGDLVEIAESHGLLNDPLYEAFSEIYVRQFPIGRSSVVSFSDQRLWGWEPPLHEVLIPIIERKAGRHRELAPELSLIIQLVNHEALREADLNEIRQVLAGTKMFRSIYVALERYPSRDFEVRRVN